MESCLLGGGGGLLGLLGTLLGGFLGGLLGGSGLLYFGDFGGLGGCYLLCCCAC